MAKKTYAQETLEYLNELFKLGMKNIKEDLPKAEYLGRHKFGVNELEVLELLYKTHAKLAKTEMTEKLAYLNITKRDVNFTVRYSPFTLKQLILNIYEKNNGVFPNEEVVTELQILHDNIVLATKLFGINNLETELNHAIKENTKNVTITSRYGNIHDKKFQSKIGEKNLPVLNEIYKNRNITKDELENTFDDSFKLYLTYTKFMNSNKKIAMANLQALNKIKDVNPQANKILESGYEKLSTFGTKPKSEYENLYDSIQNFNNCKTSLNGNLWEKTWLIILNQEYYPCVYAADTKEKALELYDKLKSSLFEEDEAFDSKKLYITKIVNSYGNFKEDTDY